MINAEKKPYKRGRLKTILQMLADAVTMNIGVLAALLLEQRWGESQSTVLFTIPLMAVITAGIFYCFRVYQIIWRFAGSREIYKIIAAAAVTEGLYYGSHQLFSNFTDKIAGMHLAVYPIAFLISLALLAWSRLLLRHRKSGENSKHVKKKRTLVIGGGRAGAMIIKDLTNNDMHIIEAVGLEGGNMSSIAAKLDITVGSLTTSMNSLVKKGYTERERSEKDRRIVYIHLTGKGRQAFHHHAKFHEQMTDAVMAELGEEEVQVLGKTLKALTDFFRSYKK